MPFGMKLLLQTLVQKSDSLFSFFFRKGKRGVGVLPSTFQNESRTTIINQISVNVYKNGRPLAFMKLVCAPNRDMFCNL